MATKKKIEVELDIESNVGGSIQQLKELKKQLRETAAGSAEFKKLSNEIDDLEDKLKGAKQGASDWIDTLQNAGGPLGLLGRGLNNVKVAFTSFNTALKASVIGLIVSTLAGLVAAFSQNESAMKKLQPVFIAFEKILGGLFRAFEPILDLFVEMAMAVLPAVTKAIGIYYSAIYGLFTFIAQVGGGVAKTLKGIFTLDFSLAAEGFEQLTNSISTAAKAGQDAYKRFTAGTQEQTKTEKEELQKRSEANDKAQQEKEKKQKEALDKRKKMLDAEIQLEINSDNTRKEVLEKLLEQRLQAELQSEKRTEAEKELLRQEYAKKLEEALKEDENKRQENEKKKLERRSRELDAMIELELLKQDTSQQKLKELLDQRMAIELSNVELSESEKELIRKRYSDRLTEAIKSDEDRKKKVRQDRLVEEISQTRGNYDEQIRLYEEFSEEIKNAENYTAAEKLRIIDENNQKIIQLQKTRFDDDKLVLRSQREEGLLTDREFFQGQRDIIDQQEQYYKSLREQGKISERQYTEFLRQTKDSRNSIRQDEVKAESDKLNAVSNLLQVSAQLVGEQTKAGKALAVSSAIINTYVAANQVLANPLILNPIVKAIQVAAIIASGLLNVKKIVSTPLPVSGGGSTGTPGGTPANTPPSVVNITAKKMATGGMIQGPGTSTSDSIPALLSDGEFVVNARSTQLFKPLLTAINDMGNIPTFAVGGLVGGKMKSQPDNSDRIVEAIQTSFGQQPIRTYVTAADISSQQQFDRVIKSRSLI